MAADHVTTELPHLHGGPDDVSVPAVSSPAGTETLTGTGASHGDQVDDEAARKLHALRDSGYTGWIDQHGDPVEDVDQWAADQQPAEPQTADPATTTEGTEPMSTITSSTGGEVMTMDQLLRELNDIARDAATDLEDAQADRKRASDDSARIENMVASLTALDLDQQTLAEVGSLADSAGQRQQASDLRASAADARLAQAEAALKGVQARHSLMQEAHANTPHPAEKAFYAS
jgi:hypothetical protein